MAVSFIGGGNQSTQRKPPYNVVSSKPRLSGIRTQNVRVHVDMNGYEKKVQARMVNNYTNINKMNNHLSPLIIAHTQH